MSSLARRAGVDRRTLRRLERGQFRPLPSLLWVIAYGADPDEAEAVFQRLIAAAAASVAPDTDGSRRRRLRRVRAAWEAGMVPLPVTVERAWRLHTAADAMWHVARGLTDRLTASGDTTGEYYLCAALRAESRQLAADGGGRIDAGLPPRRRFRSDPADVSPVPPAGADQADLWRWLQDWQVREGRRPPRTVRERAIAETGARERDRVRAHPGPVTRLVWLPEMQERPADP